MSGVNWHIAATYGIALVALAMLYSLVYFGMTSADGLATVLVALVSGLGVDGVHRAKDKELRLREEGPRQGPRQGSL